MVVVVFAMNSDLSTISKKQLREYVIGHPNDKESFCLYVDALKSSSSGQSYPSTLSPEEIEQAIMAYVGQNQAK
jgi:hypothetical protein